MVNSCLCDKVAVRDTARHMIELRDKIARQNCRCDISLMLCVCIQPCDINSPSQLTCVIPSIRLPEEFSNLGDPSLTFPYNNLSLDFSPVTSYNDRNSTLVFNESVLLDGVTYRWNESFHFQFISLLPKIFESGPYDSNKTPLIIQVC